MHARDAHATRSKTHYSLWQVQCLSKNIGDPLKDDGVGDRSAFDHVLGVAADDQIAGVRDKFHVVNLGTREGDLPKFLTGGVEASDAQSIGGEFDCRWPATITDKCPDMNNGKDGTDSDESIQLPWNISEQQDCPEADEVHGCANAEYKESNHQIR